MTAKREPIKLRDPNFAGFYHVPPIWIGDIPRQEEGSVLERKLTEECFSRDLECGASLKVSKEGLFIFDFTGWPSGSAEREKSPLDHWQERILARMRFMNAFLACFYTSLRRVQKATTEKLFIDNSSYIAPRVFGLNPWEVATDTRQAAIIRDAHDYHLRFRAIGNVIDAETLSTACAMMDAMLSKGEEPSVLSELVLHAFHLHENGKFEASHVAAWAVTERCLFQMWEDYLRTQEQRHRESGKSGEFMDRNRRAKLRGRDFTASTVSEALSLAGVLDLDVYQLLTQVRQTRNAWLHKLSPVSAGATAAAIRLSQIMLRKTELLDLDIPFHVIGNIPINFQSDG